MDLIIKNGKIVTAEKTFIADIGIEGEKIKAIGKNIKCDCPHVKIINAKNMLVMPGGIDVHVHFNLPLSGTCSEDWDTGTKSAACGGVTTVIDFTTQERGSSLKKAVEERIKEAEEKSCIDFSIHGCILEWNETIKKEVIELTKNFGVPSFKMFMSYRKEGRMVDDAALFSAFEVSFETGATIMLHAENGYLLDLLIERYHTKEMMEKYGAYCHTLARPCFTEYEAIQRAATLAKITGGRVYIVHMSTSEGAEIVEKAKEQKVNIWAETCPQYLLFTDEVFKKENGHYYATCPQVKKKHDVIGLLKAIKNNTIEFLATDTCSFNTIQKNMWNGDFTKIPYGLPVIELFIPTMFTFLVGKKNVSLNKFVSLISTNPAKLFGMYPKKGTIKVGSDADIMIFDPNKKITIDYKNLVANCDWTPFQGMKLKGYPIMVISRGEIIVENGKFIAKPGRGKFVKRTPGGKI